MSSPSSHPAADQPAPPCVIARPEQERWFKEEVHPHDGQLKSWLRGQFPSVRDIDDVVQESYLRIWKTQAIRPITSAKSFLFTIARNLAINVLRRERINPVALNREKDAENVLEDRPSAAELLTHHEKMELLSDALVALPAKTRVIFILHKFDGLTQAAVAAKLAVSEKTVEYQILRGLQLCEAFFRSRGF